MARFHVGVDVGRTQHVARVLDTATANMSRSFPIPVGHEGFERFRRYLEGFSPDRQDFFVAIEATGAYHVPLAGYLFDCGYMLALVNPARAKAFRKAEGHVAKTDRVDAGVLCRMVSGVGLRPAAPKPEEQERLRVLTRWYFRLQQDRTRALNRVSAAIDTVFPEFWQVFSEITQVTPRLVLQTYGTPDELVRADTEAIAGLLRRASRGRYLWKDAEYLQTLASRTVGVRNLYAPVALQIRQALAQVDLIDQQIRELEPLIEQEFHAMGFTAEEFPIGGVTTIATIIAHLPSPQSTPSLKSLHAYVGWCPMDRQSGQYKSTRPRMAKGCPPLRWALYGLALASMAHVEGYKQYVTRRKSQGKKGGHILVIIGRKLLDHIWAVARTKEVFLPVAPTPLAEFRREELAVRF
jgi:transposase